MFASFSADSEGLRVRKWRLDSLGDVPHTHTHTVVLDTDLRKPIVLYTQGYVGILTKTNFPRLQPFRYKLRQENYSINIRYETKCVGKYIEIKRLNIFVG